MDGSLRRRRRAKHGTITVLLATAFTVGSWSAAGADSTDECVKQRMADGEQRAEALAACLRQANTDTTDTTEADDEPTKPSKPDEATADDGGGTSVGMLALAAVVGAAVGGGAVAAFARPRRGTAGAGPHPAMPLAPVATAAPGPPMMAPPGAPPGVPPAGPPAGPDRSRGLIVALVDLADRVSSQALRAEIIATLARADVHQIDVAAGEPFDATRMRGVGSAPAPDPSWAGRVASTDRPGFRDGAQLIRLPDVVVFTTG